MKITSSLRPSLMDRWALSELQLTVRTVTERLDAYDVTAAGRAIGRIRGRALQLVRQAQPQALLEG